jgi:hypothetical protein
MMKKNISISLQSKQFVDIAESRRVNVKDPLRENAKPFKTNGHPSMWREFPYNA